MGVNEGNLQVKVYVDVILENYKNGKTMYIIYHFTPRP